MYMPPNGVTTVAAGSAETANLMPSTERVQVICASKVRTRFDRVAAGQTSATSRPYDPGQY